MNVRSKTADRALDTPRYPRHGDVAGQTSGLTSHVRGDEARMCQSASSPGHGRVPARCLRNVGELTCQPARLMTIVNETRFPTKHSDAIMKRIYAGVPQVCGGIIYAPELPSHCRD